MTAVLLTVLLICVVGKRKIEWSIGIVFCCWMLLLTTLAALNRLTWMDYISPAVILLDIAWLTGFSIQNRKDVWTIARKNILTPGLLIFAILAVLFFYAAEPMVVWWADDVYYWALEPKAIWYLGGLTDSLGSLAGDFCRYMPGMAVMQWFTMRCFGEFRESLLYYTLFMSYLILLLPLCARITWKQWWMVLPACAALIALPILANTLSYIMLSVDTALAACTAFVLLALHKKDPDWLAVAAGLCGMVLIKQSGILLAVLALGYWVCTRAGKSGAGHSRRLPQVGAWLSPAAVWVGWTMYCTRMEMSGIHEQETFSNLISILSGTYQFPENWQAMPGALFTALTTLPTTEKFLTGLPILAIPKLCWLILLIAMPLLMVRAYGKKPMVRLSAFVLVGEACYLLMILLSFLTTFNQEINSYTGENINNLRLLMERYLSPLILGLGALEAWYLTGALAKIKLPWRISGAVALCACLLVSVNYSAITDTLIPDAYLSREDTLSVTDQTEETNFWAEDLYEPLNSVVLIGFGNDSAYIENLNYTYTPARIVLPVTPEGDTEALVEDIQSRHINYIVCLDDANSLFSAAQELTEDGWLDTYTLYEVVTDNDKVTLVCAE